MTQTHFICRSDDPQWLKERRKRITASDLSVFTGTAPSFWSDTRDDLLERKLRGVEKEMDDRGKRRAEHGKQKEAVALELAGKLLGYPTARYSYLIGHSRWPYLAATLDGLLFPHLPAPPNTALTSEVGLALEVRETLSVVREPVLCEVKVTDSGHRYKDKSGEHAGQKAWVDYTPDYHRLQVQAGLAMAGLQNGLLCGLLGGDDLICRFVPKEAGIEERLDEINADAESVLRELWP